MAVLLSLLTVPIMNIDLKAPIWAIDHVAALLFVSIDTAHQHTYSPTFPAARAGFARNLWLREDVLAWFADLPSVDPSRSKRKTHGARVAKSTTRMTPVVTAAAKAVSPLKSYAKRASA